MDRVRQLHCIGRNPGSGVYEEGGHELEGKCIKGKILIFPSGKGTAAWGRCLIATHKHGNGPLAIITRKLDTLVANGVIATQTPMVSDMDRDPCQIMKTGDWVVVDASHGLVQIYKKSQNH